MHPYVPLIFETFEILRLMTPYRSKPHPFKKIQVHFKLLTVSLTKNYDT